jgi:hypothetical protein
MNYRLVNHQIFYMLLHKSVLKIAVDYTEILLLTLAIVALAHALLAVKLTLLHVYLVLQGISNKQQPSLV